MISAPAKIILFGEHAAVYSQPAIAVPVNNLRAYASVHPASAEVGLKLVTNEDGQSLPMQIDPTDVNSAFATTVRLVLAHCQAEMPNAEIRIDSDIPVASGLGSGAAVTTVLAKAVAESIGHPLTHEVLNEIVFEVEKIYHGTPSGIDNTVIVYERPIYFIKGRPIELLSIAVPLTLLIADTGIAASTKIAVGDVRRLYEAQPEKMQTLFSSIGAITNRARLAIETGDFDALGPLMMQNHALLRTLTVSSPELEALILAATSAGAIGAKLSGGGHGGNMIALVRPEGAEAVRDALLQAGAVKVHVTTVG